jgi:hypothetical protein
MVHTTAANQARYFATQTGGQGDQPLIVVIEEVPVDTRSVIEAILVSGGNESTEVAITRAVLAKEDQVSGRISGRRGS